MRRHTPFVKICGITNLEDGIAALEGGARILGVVLSNLSPRKGSQEVIRGLKNVGAEVAGVYTDMDSIRESEMNEDYVQIHFPHGTDEITFVRDHLKKKVISVVKPQHSNDPRAEALELLGLGADYSLIDFGGDLSRVPASHKMDLSGMKTGVAGRISMDNIGYALSLNPYFLDISSRIEEYPGKKDHGKMIELMELFRNESELVS
ncbi:MAG: phosphoribosylanthranilate isomerase [Candidatus Thermoplasmatota archaeon]|nr:phosphoribosylanthranilate isomerase [Candidatus Thermoplasmatota archaeon]MDA8142540.1 phosphoribosylanthranilate isomerase [Thermoplasmatales archaeon]